MAEAYAIMPLDKVQGVACFATAPRHASEQAFAWGYDEIGGFGVVVERAKPCPVLALLFEFNASALNKGYEVGF